MQQEDYEVPGVSEVTELLEEDEAEDEETYDGKAVFLKYSYLNDDKMLQVLIP